MYVLIGLFIATLYIYSLFYLVNFLVKFIKNKVNEKRVKVAVLTILYLAPFAEYITSETTLRALYLIDGGVKYFTSSDPESGIYLNLDKLLKAKISYSGCNEICLNWLFDGEFAFVEMKVNSFKQGFLPVGTGYVQYSLQKKGHLNCHLFEKYYLTGKYIFAEKFRATDKCLAITKSDKRQAKIEINSEVKKSFRLFGAQYFVKENHVIQLPNVILASHTWVSVRAPNGDWLMPFLHRNSIGSDIYWYAKLKPTTHFNVKAY